MSTQNKSLIINEDDLYYSILLENDNSGSIIEPKAIEGGFRRQNKRHITILGGSTQELLRDILNTLSNEERKKILNEIKNLLENLEWKFIPKEIYRIQKQDYFDISNVLEKRESYINIIDIPDIDIFYEKLNSLLKSDLPVQTPHITLFTKGERENPSYYGISISSSKEFKKLNPKKII